MNYDFCVILFWIGILITILVITWIVRSIVKFKPSEIYEVSGKRYKIVLGPPGSSPCKLCCFTREECRNIVNKDSMMACHCEFITKPYYCEEIQNNYQLITEEKDGINL